MENKISIEQELREISPLLAQIGSKNVFSVPPVFFDDLSSAIIDKIKTGQEETFYFSRENLYEVPQNYFAALPDLILQKALAGEVVEDEVFEEMEVISPLLNSISKKPVFTVPEGFFEKVTLPETNVKPAGAVVVPFTRKKFFAYAVAAVVTAILAIGLFLITGRDFNNDQNITSSTRAEIEKLSEDEIVTYLKLNSPADDVTLIHYNGKETDIKKAVDAMSDKEIQQYLQEMEDPGEI